VESSPITPLDPEPSQGAAAEPCLNCGAELRGPVCSRCGQKRAAPIAVRRLLGELEEHLVGLDFRLLRTVRELFSSPGDLLRGYLAGRRIRYTNPLKLLFVAATVYLLVVTSFDLRLSLQPEGQQSATIVVALLNYLVFLFLVPAAWWLEVLFRGSGRNWAESYVAVCYLWAGYLLLAAGLGVAMLAVGEHYFWARTAAGLVYLVVALRDFYRLGWWTAIWKGTLFYAGYFVATMLVMAVVITVAHLVGFEPLRYRFER
jgi:hypothetical protein